MNSDNIINIILACTSILSLFVAVRALKVSSKTTQAQIQHNVLSMMPVCEIFTANYDDGYLAVEIQNKGLGLMRIESVSFIDKQKVNRKQLIDCIPDRVRLSYFHLEKNQVIMAREKHRLVWGKNLTKEEREGIINNLSDVKVHIEYNDVYSNKYSFDLPIEFV